MIKYKKRYNFNFVYTPEKMIEVSITDLKKKTTKTISPNDYIVKENTLTFKKDPKDFFE